MCLVRALTPRVSVLTAALTKSQLIGGLRIVSSWNRPATPVAIDRANLS
jgi:hypothetical protein